MYLKKYSLINDLLFLQKSVKNGIPMFYTRTKKRKMNTMVSLKIHQKIESKIQNIQEGIHT